jgi:pimeloyl-ACP methyl ester carboxylesterase
MRRDRVERRYRPARPIERRRVPPKDELRGWARLIAAVADQVVVRAVHDMHRAISDGAFRWVGPPGRPVQAVHDAVTDGVYGAVSTAIRGAGELGALAADHLGTDGQPPSRAALKARAIAHGVVGDELMAHAPELDLEVTLRHAGSEVALDAAGLEAAYPAASSHPAVFVHGLVDSEAVWDARSEAEVSLPEVAAAAGWTPLMLRYGTGRSIGRNGADLAELLEAVTAAWPVPVTQLTIVGHSMGGLLARAACATAQDRDHAWITGLTDIVYLGTPHLGSWLEKVANVGSWVLRHASSHSAPIGTLLDGRSRGIKDLRFGTLVDDGWGTTPVDDLLTGLVPDGPWLDRVTHHLVVGRLHPSARHPLNAVFGDALVRSRSASGTGRRRRIGAGGPVVVVEVESSHTAMSRHPDVGSLLLALAPGAEAETARIGLQPA